VNKGTQTFGSHTSRVLPVQVEEDCGAELWKVQERKRDE